MGSPSSFGLEDLRTNFFHNYGIHLVKLPREGIKVLDIFMGRKNEADEMPPLDVNPFGNLEHLLKEKISFENDFHLQSANLEGESSVKKDNGFSIKFLQSFLGALGMGGDSNKLEGELSQKNVKKISCQFTNVVYDKLDSSAGPRISRAGVDTSSLSRGYTYFAVTEVYRSNELELFATDDRGRKVSIDVNAFNIAGGSLKLHKSEGAENKIKFEGQKKLAFAIRLFEINIQSKGKVILTPVEDPMNAAE